MTTLDSIQIFSSYVMGIGVLIALIMKIIQTRLSIKQMKLDFFTEYTRRYQEIILHLLENINKPDFDFSTLKEADHEKFDETMRYIRVYFDLWSEEYYLHQEGKIVNSP